ncbi:nucleoside triphosphate pyrophosphohydrolase [Ktedonospora formicarum]|uniref:Nucleoside triphosphate pyrophosphohydrolase n=1 Tax=Ktedonospora formicarum TaxID=2778364 RepID=A0A8J3I388_9CHLR|nr:nucleoside triphosphate pyrophosphohydrolase [Ktedonospora formicarum]GHO44659.1 nucleoside triphosphate pyrophosphohydrolase [Ktedonospora formicarum]
MKTTPSITILGLGPGSTQDLTVQAHALLAAAAQEGQVVYFRTVVHPTVDQLRQELPTLRINSFDSFYDESSNWQSLYQRIADEVCALGAQTPIIYAVPGHPLMGEISVRIVLETARAQGLTTSVVAGLSFMEPVCSLLGLDPFDTGLQIVDATILAGLESDEIAGTLIPTAPLMVTQVYNRRLASQVKLTLSECYPDEWPVRLVRAAGVASEEEALEMPLYALDHNNYANHLSTLYVPPLDQLTPLRLPDTLRYITKRLRREPDGCPWDRQQTHQTLIRYVIEETYEVVEAIEENDMQKLADELGDLLLQVYLHAEIARQEGSFSIGDVYENINAKMLRRHPHVFGDTEAHNAGQVAQNWEEIKRQERLQAGTLNEKQETIFKDIPQATPALMVAQEYQKRAAKTGFEFENLEQVIAKLDEELQELRQANTQEEQHEELGDILFLAAKLARWYKIDAEEALRASNRKFRQRFQAMEAFARQEQRELTSYDIEEWIALWRHAKQQVKQAKSSD